MGETDFLSFLGAPYDIFQRIQVEKWIEEDGKDEKKTEGAENATFPLLQWISSGQLLRSSTTPNTRLMAHCSIMIPFLFGGSGI